MLFALLLLCNTLTHFVILAASARRTVISTFSDRRFSVWAKWGGGPVTGPPGPTCFRPGRTFGRVTTP